MFNLPTVLELFQARPLKPIPQSKLLELGGSNYSTLKKHRTFQVLVTPQIQRINKYQNIINTYYTNDSMISDCQLAKVMAQQFRKVYR